jgi:hypothetical protein
MMRELDDITDIREDHRLIWLRVQKAAERGKGLRLTPHEVSVLVQTRKKARRRQGRSQ